jgi:hypothetical protein
MASPLCGVTIFINNINILEKRDRLNAGRQKNLALRIGFLATFL